MKAALTRATDLMEVLNLVATASDSSTTEAERWRLGALHRALRAMSHSRSFADKGALLREATRLADGSLTLPFDGSVLTVNDLASLVRFGLEAHARNARTFDVILTDREPLPEPLGRALRLDPVSRRPYEHAIADAVLHRATEFNTYQTPTQKAALRAVVTMPPGGTLSVTMPTGAGKSLVFQAGVGWWRQFEPGACAAVIVPTIALAQDHERTLRTMPGLSASRAITSELSTEEQVAVLRDFNRGEVPILILSPELALGRARESLLTAAKPPDKRPLAAKGSLTAFVIDEAHIVESWGRSFRPDFQRLPGLVQQLRSTGDQLRLILLSATLGDEARAELRRGYGFHTSWLDIDARVPRYELDIVSLPFPSPKVRDEEVLRVVDRLPRPALVYTTKVEHANAIYNALKSESGYERIAVFTGGVSDSGQRRKIVQAWSEDRLDLVVATSAFGLGIDKSNVRAVVHACVPESTARYYQEIGRAARDGHQALALCLWHRAPGSGWSEKDDRSVAFGLATRQWMTVDLSLKRWRAIVQRPGAISWSGGRRYIEVNLDALREGLGSRESSDYNRLWNMTLLNLLQRAGAVVINIVDPADYATPVWQAEVRDPRILDAGESGANYLRELFSLREVEQARSREDVRQLIEILDDREPEDCLLASVFRAVEAGDPSAEPCGHCSWCRRVGWAAPDRVPFKGLASTWPQAPQWTTSRFPSVPVIIHPDDPSFERGFRQLLMALATAGIEQFVVPRDRAAECGAILAESPARAGLVLKSDSLVDASGWGLANLPTAALLESDFPALDLLYDRLRSWEAGHPEQSLVLVAPPGLVVNRKPLEQIASVMPTYGESHLAALHGTPPQEDGSTR